MMLSERQLTNGLDDLPLLRNQFPKYTFTVTGERDKYDNTRLILVEYEGHIRYYSRKHPDIKFSSTDSRIYSRDSSGRRLTFKEAETNLVEEILKGGTYELSEQDRSELELQNKDACPEKT